MILEVKELYLRTSGLNQEKDDLSGFSIISSIAETYILSEIN